jgi:hypothetical protein
VADDNAPIESATTPDNTSAVFGNTRQQILGLIPSE